MRYGRQLLWLGLRLEPHLRVRTGATSAACPHHLFPLPPKPLLYALSLCGSSLGQALEQGRAGAKVSSSREGQRLQRGGKIQGDRRKGDQGCGEAGTEVVGWQAKGSSQMGVGVEADRQ